MSQAVKKRYWVESDLPELTGKTVIVTGANSGIGFEAARRFALNGAQVVMACRNMKKAEDALQQIKSEAPQASVEILQLDLSSLESIKRFSEVFSQTYPELHVLCNNAGVFALPYSKTADGFEKQFGVNHLGHFALTGHLLKSLLQTPNSRVVNVSSMSYWFVRLDFDDLFSEKKYSRWGAYAKSKLANMLFTYQLQKLFEEQGVDTIAVSCHPGYAASNLQASSERKGGWGMPSLWRLINGLIAQSARKGAWPTMYAAFEDDVKGGCSYGPWGLLELWGSPVEVPVRARARDAENAQRLWQFSVEQTGVDYAELCS